MGESAYTLRRAKFIIRTTDDKVDLLTDAGWHRCRFLSAWALRHCGRQRPITDSQAAERYVEAGGRAGNFTKTSEGFKPGGWRATTAFGRLLGPPLGLGAPRLLAFGIEDAKGTFAGQFGEHVTTDLAEHAKSGYDGARERLTGIERRATLFLQGAGLTTTAVLANAGLLLGKDHLADENLRSIATVSLAFAAVALIIAGLYALVAVMASIEMVNPDLAYRIVDRSALNPDEALIDRVAALLVAQRRCTLAADWRLARNRRATIFFVLGIAGVAATTAIVIVAAST